MTDPLERALDDLATAIEFPPTPNVRAGVARRVPEPGRRRWAPFTRALALAVIALLVLAAGVVALGLVPGLRLVFVPSVPSVSAPADAVGTRLALGEPVPIAEVAHMAPAALGTPDEAYAMAEEGQVVSLVYGASDRLPELDGSAIGLLVQVTEGALVGEQVEKLVPEVGARVTPVAVGGASGYWIEGPPHLLRYLGPDGSARTQATRLVGDVLVWERDGALYRIESELGLAATLRIAESIGR